MLAMYAKLFSRITESSLMEEPIPTRYVFMMMLAISDPKGYVIGTDVAIARRVNLSVAEFRQALESLMAPDEHSNSKEHEGRRVIQSDGERGYYLVNYTTYSKLIDEDGRRTYMREYMRQKRAEAKGIAEHVSDCKVNSKQPLAPLTHVDGEAKADGKGKKKEEPSAEDLKLPFDSEEFSEAWEDWRKFKREKRQTLTPSTIKLQLSKLRGIGEDRAIAAIETSICHGWTGIFEEKGKKAEKPEFPEGRL